MGRLLGPAPGAGPGAGSGQAEPPHWTERLTPEQKKHKSLEKFKGKSEGDLFQSYVELEAAFGKKTDGLVKIPDPAKPEEVAAWRKAIGIPESPEAYTLVVAKDLEAHITPDARKRFAGLFHAEGVPPAVADKIVGAYATYAQQQTVALQRANKQALDAHRDQVGQATFDRQAAFAKYAEENLLPEPVIAKLHALGFENDPVIFAWLAQMGQDVAEDRHVDTRFITGGQTSEQMERRISAILEAKGFLVGKADKQAELEGEFSNLQKLLQEAKDREAARAGR